MVQLWIASVVLGLVSFPVAKKYWLGKILGLLVVAYGAFLLGTLRLVPIGWGVWGVLGVWTLINLIIWKKKKVAWPKWGEILETEAIFGILFIFFVWVKGHAPQIVEIERFMDFGFIKALFNASYLPLADIWMAGKPLNYYYFGHFIGFTLLKISQLSPEDGFFLLQAWVFATLAVIAYGFGRKWGFWAGLVSLFCVVFAGEWQTLTALNNFWYPAPTRMIPGTITEMPIYAFLISDLHAHVWGLLLGAVVVAVLADLPAILLAFLLGLAIMTNTWDYLTLGFLVFVLAVWQKKWRKIIYVFAGAVLVASLWLFFFRSPVTGWGLVATHSPLVTWLLFWGAPLSIFIFQFLIFKQKHEKIITVLLSAAIFWLVFLEVFYARDVLSQGEWFRANSYFKVALQVWLWLGMVSGPIALTLINKNKFWIVVIGIWLATRAVYPVKAINQAALAGRDFTGTSTGLDWWKLRFPTDFAAYEFLKTQKPGVILEADGDSYSDTSRFSVFLGWPTVAGWAVHEWTWRGSYDEVGKRAGEVREVYTGFDENLARSILDRYQVKYIVIGQVERKKYGTVNENKLEKLTKVIFQSGETKVLTTY